MRKTLVAGNWKMNGTRESIKSLLDTMKQGIGSVPNADVAVCVPFVYLAEVESMLTGTAIKWGAQNLYQEPSGAFTGETSAAMLNEFHCTYVILGHSERRHVLGESDELIEKKYAAALRDGLTPILCVGELLEEREKGETESVVARQLDAIINSASGVASLKQAVVAYEPVWAIGTGKTATPDQAQEVHNFIRKKIAGLDQGVADNLQLIYGGSVKGANATELFKMPDIDGGLIGGASLDGDEILKIASAA